MNASPRFCTNCGSALPPEARFCKGCGQPVQSQPVEVTPVQATAQPTPVKKPVRRPKRRRGGCCLGCLGVMLVLALSFGALFFWWGNRPSDMLTLGGREKVSPRRIVSEGGRLTGQRPRQPDRWFEHQRA